ncbi:hypothetical protein NMS_0470 [Nonlabens marinus S1-08]|uniref:Transmembrane protein n=2 Tax=Nonlabens TaxID=363408 RepID=W8VNI1_9FLAO|nr:hypothetical protein NMS_0470 [Nonlabens marinus S1-08]
MGAAGFFQLLTVFLVVAACGIHNASILTVQKPTTVLHLFIASIMISTFVIVLNLFIL